jgi:hypothetical protein
MLFALVWFCLVSFTFVSFSATANYLVVVLLDFDLIVFYKRPQKKFTKIERIDVNHKKVQITLDLIFSKLTHWSKPISHLSLLDAFEHLRLTKKYADYNYKCIHRNVKW